MAGSDESRPRAQYGEYATPEEQQRARGLPESTPEATAAADAGAPAAPAADATPPAPGRGSAPAESSWPAVEGKKHPHPVDRVVTYVLLAIGLFVLLNGIPGYLALPDALQMAFDQLGAGTYGARDVAASLGVAALAVQVIIWVATAASAWFAMKRGRLAWWIAVLGAVLSFIAMMVIVSVALFADPGFIDGMSTQTLP